MIDTWIFCQYLLRNVIYCPLFGQFSIIFGSSCRYTGLKFRRVRRPLDGAVRHWKCCKWSDFYCIWFRNVFLLILFFEIFQSPNYFFEGENEIKSGHNDMPQKSDGFSWITIYRPKPLKSDQDSFSLPKIMARRQNVMQRTAVRDKYWHYCS